LAPADLEIVFGSLPSRIVQSFDFDSALAALLSEIPLGSSVPIFHMWSRRLESLGPQVLLAFESLAD
jgi:hypothetical protein